jgi:hypothetical protein
MTQDKMDILQRELDKLAKKYGLISASFCATEKETGEFIGTFQQVNTLDIWQSVLNIGRLWQHARETTRGMLNKFEKKGWA